MPIEGLPSSPDHNDLAATLHVRRDGARDDLRLPAAMAAEGERVGLLLDHPEAVQAHESVLRARHLLDAPAALAQDVDERRVDARATSAPVALGVLVEQAVRYEGDAREEWNRSRLQYVTSEAMGRYEASATVDWSGFGGSVESASGMLATATAAQVELGGPAGPRTPRSSSPRRTPTASRRRSRAWRARAASSSRTSSPRRACGSSGATTPAITAWRRAILRCICRPPADERDLKILVNDATVHCPVCQAIRGNVEMQVTASFGAPVIAPGRHLAVSLP